TDGVPVIALATQRAVYEKTLSNAKETKSRGGKVLLFTTKDAVVPEGIADYVVRLDEYEDLFMPLQLIVPLQLFAYYMAVLRGCDVDKPRNLAKSVTVESRPAADERNDHKAPLPVCRRRGFACRRDGKILYGWPASPEPVPLFDCDIHHDDGHQDNAGGRQGVDVHMD